MLKLFAKMDRKNKVFVLTIIIFIVLQVYLDLKLPDYLAEITFLVQGNVSNIQELWSPAILMFLCAIASSIIAVIVGYLVAHTASSFSVKLRGLLFDKILKFSLAELNRFSPASLITRSINDVAQVQALVITGLQILIKSPILAVWAIIKISDKNWQWTTMTGIAVLILVSVLTLVILLVAPKFKMIQKLTDGINRVAREQLLGIRFIRAYNAENEQNRKFEEVNEQITKVNLFTSRVMSILMPMMTLMMSALTLAIYWIGAHLIYKAEMGLRLSLFTDMVVFSSYAVQVVMSFMMLSMVFVVLPRAIVSGNRIAEVLDTKISIIDTLGEHDFESSIDSLQFKNVWLKHTDASDYVLKNINFSIKKGQTLAIIGATGSGKTSLIQLIPRLIDVSQGEILLNSINIKQFPLATLRKHISYVTQKDMLFGGTIQENISFGDEVTNIDYVKLNHAIDVSQASEFISSLEHKEQAIVASRGQNFSGGQKQRLSIARAIYKNAAVRIFDDSFSALDYKTERNLHNRLLEHKHEHIDIIVAQRVLSIKEADVIVVLDQGEIVGIGQYDYLLDKCTVFQEIAYSQLTKEEVQYG